MKQGRRKRRPRGNAVIRDTQVIRETQVSRETQVIRDGGRPTRLYYWSEDTADAGYETGVQRVVRRLGQALACDRFDVVPVGWDRTRRHPKPLTPRQRQALGLRHRVEASDPFADAAASDWLLIPEIPIPRVVEGVDVAMVGRAYGLRTAAIVHDLIPIKLADCYDPATVALFRAYYRMFAVVDLAIATTRYVAEDLRRHLAASGLPVPEMVVCPLPAQFASERRRTAKKLVFAAGQTLKAVTVSSWEPRKNCPRVLRALEAIGGVGGSVALTIVGRRGAFPTYDAEVEHLVSGIPGVDIVSTVDDAGLADLYDTHHLSIYSSWEEGFGLPVLESLWFATPCLCHEGSAMAEVAPGGGTMMIDMTDDRAVFDALLALTRRPDLHERLVREAVERPLSTWSDYAEAVGRELERPLSSRA